MHAYQKIKKSLKHKTGPNEYISQILSSKYIIFCFRTFCILFSFLKKTYFGCGLGVDLPPPVNGSVSFLSLPLGKP